jgi:23S rRNA (cytidine2498-2'-O)-methyltransferase
MADAFHMCKPGTERFCARELELEGLDVAQSGDGWVRSAAQPVDDPASPFGPAGLCFPTVSILDAVDIEAASANAQAAALCELFWNAHRGERIEDAWWLHVGSAAERTLAKRARVVESEVRTRLHKQVARVARLASDRIPANPSVQRGLTAHFLDFERIVAGTRFCHWGQRRMRDDRDAPSRSYLKVEEAYAVLGTSPGSGETVADLGAAPGGWSFSAARRGALVTAVDNGPLKGGAADHALIEHIREDAFGFRPPAGRTFDWLFCDLIEDPERVFQEILLAWAANRWCRRFVVNLKVGKADPVQTARRVRADAPDGLLRHCDTLRVRHLYHDREEITCVGIVRT